MPVTDSARPADAAVRTNWAGNHRFVATTLAYPADVEAVQAVVRAHARSGTRIKALGAGHSFNAIADSPDTQLSLQRFSSMALDRDARTVTVGAGVPYGQLAPWLDAQGFALHNLASLPHISVAGACATGTHGSGRGNGCLSTAVAAIEFVSGTGELVQLSRSHDRDVFDGSVVALGALGIVTSITLDLVPSFQVAQTIYQDLLFSQLDPYIHEIFASAYSVSLFTDWQQHRATQAWLKQRADSSALVSDSFYGARLQTEKLHPLAGLDARNCTEQQGIPGAWYERLPHFRMEFTPSSGAELQSEYFVAFRDARAAIKAIEALRDHITPLLIVSELRAVAADDLWLSMAYKRDSFALHFTWRPEWAAVQRVLPLIEEALAPFDARPHWAKVFTTPAAQLRSLYPRFTAFEQLRKRFDPEGLFLNPFLGPVLAA